MKANELRVGNHYYYHIVDELDKRKEWDEICIIDAADIEFLVENPDDKDFKPIPLTPEAIKKCSDIEEINGYTFKILPSIGIYVMVLKWSFLERTFSLFVNDQFVKRQIASVHEFENLHYAMTGEELEIKF